MTVVDRVGGHLQRGPVAVDLDDIQATVLRYRPEPYYGTHVMLHVDDRVRRTRVPAEHHAAHRLCRRVVADRRTLDRGRDHLLGSAKRSAYQKRHSRAFPEAFRVGMAARAHELRDDGANDPKNWEPKFRNRAIHIGVTVFSASEDTWRRTMETARDHYDGDPD